MVAVVAVAVVAVGKMVRVQALSFRVLVSRGKQPVAVVVAAVNRAAAVNKAVVSLVSLLPTAWRRFIQPCANSLSPWASIWTRPLGKSIFFNDRKGEIWSTGDERRTRSHRADHPVLNMARRR